MLALTMIFSALSSSMAVSKRMIMFQREKKLLFCSASNSIQCVSFFSFAIPKNTNSLLQRNFFLLFNIGLFLYEGKVFLVSFVHRRNGNLHV